MKNSIGARTARILVGPSLIAAVGAVAPTQAHADGGLVAWDRDKVYVVDHTSSRWPVRSVAERVDNHSPLNLVRTKRCPKGAQCIHVRIGSLPDEQWGLTSVAWDVNSKDIVEADITLNPKVGKSLTLRQRKATICHELMHAVGVLDHRHTEKSCLYDNLFYAKPSPDKKDYATLRRMY